MSEPPKLIFTPKRKYTIALTGTVGLGPGVGLTLVAGPITFPYRIVGAEVVFRNDTFNLLPVYLLVSRDTTTSATTPPADSNLLAPFVPNRFLLGDGLIKRVTMDYTPESDQQYIKAHAINGCTYAQTINVTVEIEEV